MKKKFNYICMSLASIIILALTSSCQDDFEVRGGDLGEGTANISFELSYTPLVNSLSRTPGDAIDGFSNLTILAYTSDGNLAQQRTFSASEINVTQTPLEDAKYAESQLATAKLKEKYTLPFGYYRIYAVGNVDLTGVDVSTEDALRSESVAWNQADVTSNNAVFGFFTTNDEMANLNNSFDFYVDASGNKQEATTAPLLPIGQSNMSLHSWMKRLASKVTVAYDGSGLNENIHIYFKSVQIKDIPKACLLGHCNTPTATTELTDGEVLTYSTNASWEAWPSISKGNPYYGSDHAESAEAMYLFENNQGIGTKHHNPELGWEEGNYNKYDNALGSYIEIKAYYVNRSGDNPSHGEITYRFMLGQDATSDFNTKRSCHYKVTLGFNGDATNPDWHIEYNPETPGVQVPDKLYISYSNNKYVALPVVIDGALASDDPTVTIQIVKNDWGYRGHKHDGFASDLQYGFLSLEDNTSTDLNTIKLTNSSSAYTTISGGTKRKYEFQLWTRALELKSTTGAVKGVGFSGYNFFVSRHREAKVRVSVQFKGQMVSKDVTVIQVERVENPTGVWRSASNESPFHVIVTDAKDENTQMYEPIISDGPWTAIIPDNCKDWVRISADGTNYGTDNVTGATGSVVQFWYKPSGTIAEGSARCGLIRVFYNNNTCVHYLFVRQGYAPVVQLDGDSFKWCTGNQYTKDQEVATPTMEGSMFRFANDEDAIAATNNFKPGYGYGTKSAITTQTYNRADMSYCAEAVWSSTAIDSETKVAGSFVDNTTNDFSFDLASGGAKDWHDITYGGPQDQFDMPVAEKRHFDTLLNHEREYGVLYGDESTETQLSFNGARAYLNPGDKKGMCGMFVFDRSTWNQIFFPIGATGFGHRIAWDCNQDNSTYNGATSLYFPEDYYRYWWQNGAHLKYSQRHLEMPETLARGQIDNISRVMLYNLYVTRGAIYWQKKNVNNDGTDYTGSSFGTGSNTAYDINYHTFGLATFSGNAHVVAATFGKEQATGKWKNVTTATGYDVLQWGYSPQWSSDACFVRCVIE